MPKNLSANNFAEEAGVVVTNGSSFLITCNSESRKIVSNEPLSKLVKTTKLSLGARIVLTELEKV